MNIGNPYKKKELSDAIYDTYKIDLLSNDIFVLRLLFGNIPLEFPKTHFCKTDYMQSFNQFYEALPIINQYNYIPNIPLKITISEEILVPLYYGTMDLFRYLNTRRIELMSFSAFGIDESEMIEENIVPQNISDYNTYINALIKLEKAIKNVL